MSHLYIPKHLKGQATVLTPDSVRNTQMENPVIFWYSAKLQHIMLPPSPIAPAPNGYERIECRHAHEVDKWSDRLRQQEKRIREMNDEERYNFEEPIRKHMIDELRANLAHADGKNREFILRSIEIIEAKREQARKERVETFMHAEAHEGVQ